MAKQKKVDNKVKKDKDKDWKFTIEPALPSEVNVEIDLEVSGKYEVDKLETETLPTNMPEPDNARIGWFNNFSIKENGNYIKKKYKVTIPGLISKLKEKNAQLVIYSDTHDPKLYYYGNITSDTFELTDGDPGVGGSPP
jgi:hypothetical protein